MKSLFLATLQTLTILFCCVTVLESKINIFIEDDASSIFKKHRVNLFIELDNDEVVFRDSINRRIIERKPILVIF